MFLSVLSCSRHRLMHFLRLIMMCSYVFQSNQSRETHYITSVNIVTTTPICAASCLQSQIKVDICNQYALPLYCCFRFLVAYPGDTITRCISEVTICFKFAVRTVKQPISVSTNYPWQWPIELKSLWKSVF